MTEIVSTRANPMIDPALHVWGWEIPVYLFLGGFVAGAMMLFGWLLHTERHRRKGSIAERLPWWGIAALGVGLLALFLDLEKKPQAWRLYTTFLPRSPMSWGAWILLFVFPVLVADAALVTRELSALLPSRISSWLHAPKNARPIAITNAVLGAALGIYTGLLLSSLGGRPFWMSAALGPLFLVSGLSSAAAFAHLTAKRVEERELFARSDNAFLAAELLFIALLLIGLSSAARAPAEAAKLVLGGPYTAVFWVGVVGIGILLPLLTQALAVSHRIHHTPIGPILVLAGGYLLRVVVVAAGQHSHFGIG